MRGGLGRIALLALVLAAASGILAGPAAAETLTLLHINDFHSQLEPFQDPGVGTVGGAAHLASAVKLIRTNNPHVLLLDAGDNVQGTAYFNFFHGVPEVGILNALGVDVMTLGNHEFDNGTRELGRMLVPARFPVVAANVVIPDSVSVWPYQSPNAGFTSSPFLRRIPDPEEMEAELPPGVKRLAFPYAVFVVGDVRVAVIGSMTDGLSKLVIPTLNPGLTALPPAAGIAPWVARLRPESDVVVVLSHAGLAADSLLAATVPGIDVIVSGHDHVALPEPRLVANHNRNGIGGTLLVEAGSRGEYLGRLDLDLERGRIVNFQGRLLPIGPGLPPDPDVAAMIEGYRKRLGEQVKEVLAQAPQGLSGEGRAEAQTPLGVYVAEVMRRVTGADLALENSGGIRATIPPGPVTVGDAYRVIPYENTIVTCTLSGARIRELLAFGLGRAGQGGYPQLAGVSWRMEDGRPADIRIGGRPLDDARDYTVATNNFVFAGGDGYTQFEGAADAQDTGVSLRDAFMDVARTAQVLEPPASVPGPR